MKKIAFGGERLGAGGKIAVDLKSYERSTHDLGFIFRSSMAVGTLVPFLVEVGLPGDTFDITLNADVKTHPALGPLFGSFKLQLDVFEIPVRLYHSALLQNTTTIGNNMQNVLLPCLQSDTIPYTASWISSGAAPDNVQIHSSALLSYLGIRGWGMAQAGSTPARRMNGIPLLGYWDIYKNFYANKQEQVGYYVNSQSATPTTQTITNIMFATTTIPQVGTGTTAANITSTGAFALSYTGGTGPTMSQIMFNTSAGVLPGTAISSWQVPSIPSPWAGMYAYPDAYGLTIYSWYYQPATNLMALSSFPLTNIDAVRGSILSSSPTSRLYISSATQAPYGNCIALSATTYSQQGLGIKTYQSDILNNWMQTTWYTSIQAATAISVSANINVDAIILARKVYDLLNRIAVSGGSYQDWIGASYDHKAPALDNMPRYHGGLSKEVIFQEVVSNSGTSTQPLATMASRGAMSKKHKGGQISIKLNEHSYLMGIVSLTPRLDYSQGNDWHTYSILTMNDFHKPGMDGIGWQNLVTEQMAWWDTELTGSGIVTPTQYSAGNQPAWINYTSRYNKCFGNFAISTNEMFMTLNRRYSINTSTGRIADLSTYIDPTKYNYIFAEVALDAQNFWVQIAIDNIARRKMSASLIPNL
jgi:hypothetical protein